MTSTPVAQGPLAWVRRQLADERGFLALTALGGVLVGGTALVHPLLPAAVVAAVMGLLASLRFPILILPGIFLAVLLTEAELFPTLTLGVPLTVGKLAVLGGGALWVAHCAATEKPILRISPVLWPALAVAGTLALSLVFALEVNVQGVWRIISVLMVALLAHFIASIAREEAGHSLYPMLAALLITVMALTLLRGPGDVSNTARASGLFKNANYWCAALLVSVPPVVGAVARRRGFVATVVIFLLVTLLGLNVLMSLSRAGLLTYLAILPLFVVQLWRRNRTLVILGIVVALVAAPAFVDLEVMTRRYEALVDVEAAEMDGSFRDRQIAAELAWRLFLENPFAGVGSGQFNREAEALASHAVALTPHNTYLHILCETGLMGLVAHLWLFAAIAGVVRKMLVNRWWTRDQPLAVGYLTSLVAMAIIGLTADLMTFAIAFFVLGLGIFEVQRGPPSRERPAAA